jgi:hypothetical protein
LTDGAKGKQKKHPASRNTKKGLHGNGGPLLLTPNLNPNTYSIYYEKALFND